MTKFGLISERGLSLILLFNISEAYDDLFSPRRHLR